MLVLCFQHAHQHISTARPNAAAVAFAAARTLTTTATVNMASNKKRRGPQPFVQEINANLHLITERPRNVRHDPQTLRYVDDAQT